MTISNIDEGAIEYITPEGSLLGFPTGINTKRFSNADTISIRKSEGIVITGSGKTISWPIVRFVEHEGKMVALGPWIENSKPFETESINHGMISRLLPAIQALKSADYPLSGLYSRAVRWLPDGGVLIYPPKLAAWMSELNLESEHWVHPDRTAEPAWSFSLGVLTWQALTGTDPFADETGEFRRERIRKRILPPMNSLVPGISKAAEAVIRKSLIGDENGTVTTLEEWESLTRLWQNEGIISNLPESELQERRVQAARKSLNIEKKLKAQRWFRLSGWKFLVSVAVTFGILAFTSAPIKKALEAPATIGMMPIEVAETYYNAISTMDSEIMEDCLSKKTGKDDVRLVTTIYVTNKMRQGYEGISDPPRASIWIKNGKPELPEGIWPWGISDLILKEFDDGRIKAQYLLWTPPEGGTQSNETTWSVSRTDILSFTEGRKSWEINTIERTTED